MTGVSISGLADLIAARSESTTPLALGRGLLREDPRAAALSGRDVCALVEAALADGTALAERAIERWGGDPEQIARANSVPVENSEADAGYGTTMVFAEYRARPVGIVLYRPIIDALERWLQRSRLASLLGIECTRSVFLAHELYHHFDETRAQALCSRHRLPVLRLGPLRLTATVAGLREVAAGAFAQRLLGLRFHPRLLDIAAVCWHRLEGARRSPRGDALTAGPTLCRPSMPHRAVRSNRFSG
jgi:hypothetical protein